MYYEEEEEGLSFPEIVDTLLALMDEESQKEFKWEYAFESITEQGSVFRMRKPIK